MCENYLSNDEYHRSEGMSAGMLNALDLSPAHLKVLMAGLREPATPAMQFGSAVHRILESERDFYLEYAPRPDGIDRRTKEGKATWAELEASGKTILDAADWQRIHAIYQAYEDVAFTDPLLKIVRDAQGVNESSIFWHEQDIPMRCRPDRLVEVHDASHNEFLADYWPSLFNPIVNKIVVDYKTMNAFPTPKQFGYRLRGKREGGFGYGLAASHYLSGTGADAFLWIVLETNPPFTVTRYLLSPNTHQQYANRRNELLELYRQCKLTEYWPGLIVNVEETLI